MNWRAVINVLGPLIFGQVYSWGSKRNWPEAVFVAASASVVAAEVVWRTIGNDALGVDAGGFLKKDAAGKK